MVQWNKKEKEKTISWERMKQSPIWPKWPSYCRPSIFESTALSALTYYISCCPRLNPSFLPTSAARCPPQRTPPAANPHTTHGLRLHLRSAAATPTSTNSAPGLHLRLLAPPRLRCAPAEGSTVWPAALSLGFQNSRPPLPHFQIAVTRDFLTSPAPTSTQPSHATAARVLGIPNPVAAMAARSKLHLTVNCHLPNLLLACLHQPCLSSA
jgi:hypothetical protein